MRRKRRLRRGIRREKRWKNDSVGVKKKSRTNRRRKVRRGKGGVYCGAGNRRYEGGGA